MAVRVEEIASACVRRTDAYEMSIIPKSCQKSQKNKPRPIHLFTHHSTLESRWADLRIAPEFIVRVSIGR